MEVITYGTITGITIVALIQLIAYTYDKVMYELQMKQVERDIEILTTEQFNTKYPIV